MTFMDVSFLEKIAGSGPFIPAQLSVARGHERNPERMLGSLRTACACLHGGAVSWWRSSLAVLPRRVFGGNSSSA